MHGTSTEDWVTCFAHALVDASARGAPKQAGAQRSDESEVMAEIVVSSDCWEEASEQIELAEDDAEELREVL